MFQKIRLPRLKPRAILKLLELKLRSKYLKKPSRTLRLNNFAVKKH
jgi:hypothetical protein